MPDYLRDAAATDGEVNFADRGFQLTRTARALKLWVSIRAFGLGAFRTAIERSLDHAELARRLVEESTVLELAAPPSLGIVCVRRRFAGVDDEDELERLHAGLVAALERSGQGLVSSTRLRGRYVIRLCPLNHTTTDTDVERVVRFLETAQPVDVDGRERDRDVAGSWLRAPEIEPARLADVPLFSSLTREDLELVARRARLREAGRGERIVEQWATTRDFFVVLGGAVEVLVDGEPVSTLGPGEFFGELAALEWAAGFGYPRLATVVATEPLELLVFQEGALNELVRAFPAVEAVVRRTAHARLGRR
jgi:hypothetical protein